MSKCKNCGPDCCQPTDDLPNPNPGEPTGPITEPPIPESKLTKFADNFLMIAFAVGVYSQMFVFFLYAFTNSA